MDDHAFLALMAGIALAFEAQAMSNLAPLIWSPTDLPVQVVSLCAPANLETGCGPIDPLPEQVARQ